ncbi:MAG: VRR-NUC domain-containing protein, partial [Candidatus Woesearchaeota archaeon]
ISLRELVKKLPSMSADLLKCSVVIGKVDYKHNISQKIILRRLREKDIDILPGQVISFVFQKGKVVLPEDYNHKPDVRHYKNLLVRSLYVLLQPFGISRSSIEEISGVEKQTFLSDFVEVVHTFVPIKGKPKSNFGLAEKQLRSRLESLGWTVWRGGSISIVRQYDVYPNVRRKYSLLCSLIEKHFQGTLETLQYLCDVHHGMPDFICFRDGKFKFVEAKLCHEQLSKAQKKCIRKLQDLGFSVEVHKLVDKRTKARSAMVNLSNGSRLVLEKQAVLAQ